MRFLSKFIALSLLLFVSISSVFAIEAPTNIQANNITESSLMLSWDPVDTAFGYHIYYSKDQGVDILTAQKQEYITKIPLLIEGLEPATQYYFIISAYNKLGEESIFSQEVSFTTTGSVALNSAQDFKLSSIEVLAQNQISLQFTSPLDTSTGAQREFKVVEKDNELALYDIQETTIDPKDPTKVLVMFTENLPVSTEFTLTVIDILDINGRNIESGIESFENFYIDESFLNIIANENIETVVDITNTGTIITPENEIQTGTGISLDSQENKDIQNQNSESNETVSVINDSVVGENIAAGEVAIDLNSAGENAKTLPKTGPEEYIILILLAMFFGFIISQSKRRV